MDPELLEPFRRERSRHGAGEQVGGREVGKDMLGEGFGHFPFYCVVVEDPLDQRADGGLESAVGFFEDWAGEAHQPGGVGEGDLSHFEDDEVVGL